MPKTLSVLVVLISIGSLAETQRAQSVDGHGCFALAEKIAFTTTRDNPNFVPIQNAAEIYLMNPDGSDPQRITENEVGDSFAVLSPDGKKIVFDSNRLRTASEPLNMVDLFVMASDGTDHTHLTRGSSASWAPDGRHITFHASASGVGLPIRMDPGAPPADSDLFILNLDDVATGQEAPINVTNSETLIEDDPDWSPDGQRIVYTAHDVKDDPVVSTTAEVFVMNADGSGEPVRLTFNTEEERAPAWSPDGTAIVFMCRYGGADFEICVMNPDGTGLQQLTNNTVPELSIKWSVDGQRFFFNRPVTGRNQLFSINVDSTGTTQLTNTVGVNLFPAPGRLRVRKECESLGVSASSEATAETGSQTISAARADALLSWTVSPGSFADDVWTIPGTTTLTASVMDAFGNPITEGELIWETCTGTGPDLGAHHPAADCQQRGPVRWRDAVVMDPANPTAISPCLCAGDRQGFRLAYRSRGSGFRSTTGAPFDLFAESHCPLADCP